MAFSRFTVCLFLAVFAVFLTSACRSPQEIFLTESDSGRTLDLCVGDTIVVALCTDGSGLEWYPRHGAGHVQILAEKSERFIVDPGPDGVRRPISVVGQRSGTHYFTYRVIGPGVCGIALDYKRSWEKKEPSRYFEIMIRATGEPEEAASDPTELPPDEAPVYMTDSKGNVTVRPGDL